MCLSAQGRAPRRRGDARSPGPRRLEEAQLRRKPPPEAGGKLPESSTRRAVRALPARPTPTAVPEHPGPRSPSPPFPPRSERTPSRHRERALKPQPERDPAAGFAQSHTFSKPRLLTSCPWDLPGAFCPALVRASRLPQSQSGPWSAAAVRTVAPSRPRVVGGG